MNILKNYIKLFLMVVTAMVFSCHVEKTSALVAENVFENTVVAGDGQSKDNESLLAELDSITEKIFATFDKSLIKNNKADAMGTSLAIVMMLGYAFIGCVPPHAASSASFVHATGGMLNQKIKNEKYSDRAENVEELKKIIQQLLSKNHNGLYTEKILSITKTIEKGVLAETKLNRRAYLARILASIPFIIGYFIF